MRASNASVNSTGAAVLVLGTVLAGGGGGAGGKPTSPANVVVAMANARNEAAKRFLGNFIFGS